MVKSFLVSQHIHFMGVAGSGMSGVAQIAASQGFRVSGCDLSLDSPYFSHLTAHLPDFQAFTGHSPDHLRDVDLLCVTPAVFYQNTEHPELAAARRRGIVLKWQEFMGKFLHRDKFVIAVTGTHGKSTTTALAGLLLESAGLDPTVEVGASVKSWHNNIRLGRSRYFVCEADEFHDNFASFHPDILILTLVEYDHPEYFGSLQNMLDAYSRFISRLKPGGLIIYNADSPLAHRLPLPPGSLPYRLADFPKNLRLSQPGAHNKLNALAIIRLAEVLKIKRSALYPVLRQFSGLERRLDLIGEKQGIKVYDDYANHPSSFAATIAAVRELYPKNRLWAVIEPHTFTRLRVMLSKLPAAFYQSDNIIVSKIFPSREADPGDFTGADIAAAISPAALYIPEFPDIAGYLKKHARKGDIILVMGSGHSHLLARQILADI